MKRHLAAMLAALLAVLLTAVPAGATKRHGVEPANPPWGSDVTVPDGTTPQTIPEGTAPDGTVPDVTVPDVTTPGSPAPEATVPGSALSTEPAYAGDFPDPFILLVGQTYWAYSTGSAGRNLQVMSSTDLKRWTEPEDPLPVLPSWAIPNLTWAPAVLARSDLYLMYYTTHDSNSGRQCTSVATSPRPQGPFVDNRSGPLVCQVEHYGSIDPYVFQAGATRYLLWKSDDNAGGQQTHLWGQRLSQDGLSLVGQRVKLLDSNAFWQDGIIEGPAMVASGGVYYLFYGAGPWSSSRAGIGFARCTTPLGPCVNQSRLQAWLPTRPGASGPSGPAVFVDQSGTTRFAYHAWTGPVGYDQGGVRALFIDTLTFQASVQPRLG